jgi:hypothetical protein
MPGSRYDIWSALGRCCVCSGPEANTAEPQGAADPAFVAFLAASPTPQVVGQLAPHGDQGRSQVNPPQHTPRPAEFTPWIRCRLGNEARVTGTAEQSMSSGQAVPLARAPSASLRKIAST